MVEDDANFRRHLQRSLERHPHITCSRVFPSCFEFLEAIQTDLHPDIVLMDLCLPGMGGVKGIQRMKAIAPEMTAIVLTINKDKAEVLQALDAGAVGYLLKTSPIQQIVNALEQVFMGGAVLSPSIAKMVIEEFRKPDPEKFDLSEREIEVLEGLSEGLSVKGIAEKLKVSRATAAFHLGNIYQKLEVQSQTGAVAKALRTGLI